MPDSIFHEAMAKWSREGFFSMLRDGLKYKIINPIIDPYLDGQVLSREEIQQICAEQGRLWEYEETDSGKRVFPQNEQVEEFQMRKEGYDLSSRKVCEIQDALVMGKTGIVMDSEGNWIDASVEPKSVENEIQLLSPKTRYQAIKQQKDSSKPSDGSSHLKSAISLLTHIKTQPTSYAHYLLEYFPMLLHLSVYETETGKKPKIIIENNSPDYVREGLEMLGYSGERIVEWNNGFAKVDRLVLPFSSIAHYEPGKSLMSPTEYRWLQQQSLSSVSDTEQRADGRFYISRQKTEKRHVTNFNEIKPILDDFDIEVIYAEDMSIEEQVRKFSEGELFVGPHGAGLFNTLFASNAKVIEIFTPNWTDPRAFLLNYAIGNDWTCIFGSKYCESTKRKEKRDSSFKLNPEVLRWRLNQSL
jgi:capsular polysaccharide biosynthesis protein